MPTIKYYYNLNTEKRETINIRVLHFVHCPLVNHKIV